MRTIRAILVVAAAVWLGVLPPASGFSLWPFHKKHKGPPPTAKVTDPKDVPKEKLPAAETPSVERLEKLAKEGSSGAQLALGKLYFEGAEGVEQNHKKAAVWFQKAADQGNARGMFNLGVCYDGGLGVDKDV